MGDFGQALLLDRVGDVRHDARRRPRTCAQRRLSRTAQKACDLLVMIEILHRLTYAFLHYTTRIPVLLAHKVYIRSCRISAPLLQTRPPGMLGAQVGVKLCSLEPN